MREKSQIEDMRAAIRGDIERARARREADPWRTPQPEQQSADEMPAAPEGPTPEGFAPAETEAAETVPQPEPERQPEPEPEAQPEPEAAAEAPEDALEVPEDDLAAPPTPQPAVEPAARPRGLLAALFRRG